MYYKWQTGIHQKLCQNSIALHFLTIVILMKKMYFPLIGAVHKIIHNKHNKCYCGFLNISDL